MSQSKWFLHPILIFISSIAAVFLSLILYIYWYVEVSSGLKGVLERAKLDPDQVLASQTWMVILVLSILVGIILMGIFIIFVYNQKTFQLYRLQRNFISNFTHELKTPVTSLKLYLETFRTYELAREDQLRYIGYMVQDADRLTHNINRILDLAKIESKTYEGKFVKKDLVGEVERFYEKHRHLFDGCEIHIHNPSGRSFLYRISPALFEILLMNLFTNAIKYNESEVPRLDISFESKGRGLHIRFEDNGIGLPKSEFRKVFKKFYQIGRSDDMSAKGTGLGLYLVESIARLHKGKTIAQSKGSGKGSVFSLILPLKTPGA
ncbi:MAG: HAMP domain-containing histidine kinase [Deltaproteobacteria bacterium]|nr:HAMP domain-containing histidine kinase [Deltaproteobacteria bacterium]MBW2047262.1 HAMP domain-containing histidine kinase [Deltaproteobacteria bacterium]MBW2352692.1 HAMP domain-containing histidine kinase [Deltaproteobacteria bacterium]